MKYKFYYVINREQNQEKDVEIEAENNEEAVLKFYDEIGMAEFGCIKADGNFFSDKNFEMIKKKILMGC